MDYAVGVDIGGTKVVVAVVNQSGEMMSQVTFPMDLSISPQNMVAKINTAIKQTIRDSKIDAAELIGIGIGAPGPLDSRKGKITCPPNLASWIDVPIRQWIEQSFSVPVFLENDANTAALAEKWSGAAVDSDNFTYLTISTGIGAGIVSNGKLLSGSRGNAGEIGHTVVDPSFGQCTCGQIGCLDLIASGRAIAKNGSEIVGKELTTKEVMALYEKGNAEIVDYIEHAFWALGAACVSLINILDTEKIVIGGGVSQAKSPLLQTIQSYVSQHALNPAGRQTEIVPAGLKENTGVIGAAGLCFFVPLIEATS